MDITISQDAVTISIARTHRSVMFNGQRFEVTELGIPLPFARQPGTLHDVKDGDLQWVYVTDTHEMTAAEFDEFASDLLKRREWLIQEGGAVGGGFLCLEIAAPGRPILYVNSEGAGYARYVARLG
ncbi:hypothetical protein [Caldimonas brevitalea]|uniref:Uncharacterized protein n=1 Tax=Caldimonas brevitalea TaxID=413882 RepID=A0A0G3BMZ9_9BURK|nr:hypothetical protein [Caldimonas brevitalea]AKJ30819.1 hypothetical protein AAW51_4128 [Caldimonas brevitalea]